jgi:hypothetical protein
VDLPAAIMRSQNGSSQGARGPAGSEGEARAAAPRREYCTYLNSQYLSRALALHASLLRHGADFRLRAVCFDEVTHEALTALELPRLEPIRLAELEAADPELAATRESRSQVEYLWTATPCVIRYLIERDGLEELTYLDADTYFFSSPEPFFAALGDGSVLLTPASSAPQHYSRRLAERAGLYVVQFMTFRNDSSGRTALEWWRERCIEWCSAHYVDGRMGDQKYLDDWPRRFQGIRNLAHPGMLGPWNIETRRIESGPDGITVDGEPLIFYHFMGLRPYGNGHHRLAAGRFRITPDQRRWIYDPYIAHLAALRAELAALDPRFAETLPQHEPLRWRLQAPLSALIGAAARTRVRLAPDFNIGPYVAGGYVPAGYRADPDASAHLGGGRRQRALQPELTDVGHAR